MSSVAQQHRRGRDLPAPKGTSGPGPGHLPAPKGTSFPEGPVAATCATQCKPTLCTSAAGVPTGHCLSHDLLTVLMLQKYSSDLFFFSYFSPVVIYLFLKNKKIKKSRLVLFYHSYQSGNERAGLFLSSFLSLSFFLTLAVSLLYTSSPHRNTPSKLDIIEQLSTMPSRALYSLRLSGLCF